MIDFLMLLASVLTRFFRSRARLEAETSVDAESFAVDDFPKMIRSIALAAILGALVAAGVLYSASEPDWRKAIAIGLGHS